MNIANAVFVATLEQYTYDPAAAAPVLKAVEAVVEEDGFDRVAVVNNEGNVNLRWFSAQELSVQTQVMALATAVKRHYHKSDRSLVKKLPAQMALSYLKLAIYIYRYLQRRKSVVNEIVSQAEIHQRAAYKAVVRTHLALVRDMRGRAETKAWKTISKALLAVTGTRVPPTVLSSVAKELFEEEHSEVRPLAMSHYANERIGKETREAFEKAGYMMGADYGPANE